MNLSIDQGPWQPAIDWDTPAGVALKKLFAGLQAAERLTITLFGSSPLQLALEPGFTSADVDLFCDEAQEEILAAIEAANLSKVDGEFYIQCCWEGNFRTSPRWRIRAASIPCGHVTLVLPHPIDILIAKLHRYEEKDRRAFELVIDRTGHPTEQEMLTELQYSVDLYRPNFDEEVTGDITTNTRLMWKDIYRRDLDVRKEIIAPALERRRRGYQDDLPQQDYKAELRRLAEG
ncbi:MAG: hypothetical protein Fur0032_00520 [Terrimicrobiaceae bacterium]